MKKILTLFTALLLLGSMTVVQAVDYYYRGNQNGWAASAMEASTDGYYAYFESPSHDDLGDDNKFKIALSAGGWDYSCYYASPGFNNTDITEMNNSSNTSSYSNGDWNNVVHSTVAFYILVYYPNTAINTTDKPIICASTTLPNDIPAPPVITLKGDFNGWGSTDVFTDNGENATFVKNISAESYEFKIMVGSEWKSNKTTIARANSGTEYDFSGNPNNATLVADYDGEYTFTYTYLTEKLSVTFPPLPATSVDFSGLNAQIAIGTEVTFAATSTGVINPGYRFYVKEQGGSYGEAVSSYTFNTVGHYVVKVDALANNTGDPVVSNEKNVEVYTTYTFTKGTRLYVDFTAMTEGDKGVNYPKNNKAELDWDPAGTGTTKVVIFDQDVEWSTLYDFIKTEEGGWDPGMRFTVPASGQDLVVVAADGASYEWSTFVPSTYFLKNNWNGGEWTWQEMTAVGDGTFKLENVVYGGHGINYNFQAAEAGAYWKDYTRIKYMDGETPKLVEAFDEINLIFDPASDTIWAEMVTKNNPVYTVAGNSLALFYLGWAPTHPYKYTDMKKQADGTYKWDNGGEKATLIAGDLKLKVIKDRDYANGSWPASDFVYNIQRSGDYEIAIHFNPWTKDIWIDTTCVQTLNIQMPLLIKGSWDNWEGATNLTLGGYNDKAIVTLSLTEGTYQFKLEDVQSKWYGDGQAFTRNNNSYKDIEAKDESATTAMTIEVDKAGDYLFTYFYDGELLLIQYPAIVPADRIAPLIGKFTINAKGDTAVFSRGNLHYNYESNAWYAAEKQYDALGDLNLRFGDVTYTGSIDLFGWSSENSDFGKQWKYKDEEFNGDFVDWGTLFATDEKEWSTLSRAEWEFLLARKDASNNKLWTFIQIGPDSLTGLVLFPDNWEAPAGLTIKYGFYDLEKEEDLRANSFSYAQWESMEVAGAVFLPLAASRAGYYGNTWSGSAISDLSNPLSLGYDWVDEANAMGYYWTTTINSGNENQIETLVLPGWHENNLYPPTYWARERRRGQSVRLVTRIPKAEHTVVRENLNPGHYYTICYPKAMTDVQGATLWSFIGKDTQFAYIQQETASTIEAGKPYILYATASTVQAILGDETNAPGANGAIHGTFSNLTQDQLNTYATVAGNDLYLVIGDELRRATGEGTGSNTLPANRAFVVLADIPAPPANMPAHVRAMPMQKDQAQGFENLDASEKPLKVVIDGQLYILRGEHMYNANGQIMK